MKETVLSLGYCMARISLCSSDRVRVQIVSPACADQVYEPAASVCFVAGPEEVKALIDAINAICFHETTPGDES